MGISYSSVIYYGLPLGSNESMDYEYPWDSYIDDREETDDEFDRSDYEESVYLNAYLKMKSENSTDFWLWVGYEIVDNDFEILIMGDMYRDDYYHYGLCVSDTDIYGDIYSSTPVEINTEAQREYHNKIMNCCKVLGWDISDSDLGLYISGWVG